MANNEHDVDATPTAVEDSGEAPSHIEGLPDALVKATYDTFMYALGIRTGEVIAFESASLSNDGVWVHLKPLQNYTVNAADWERFPMRTYTAKVYMAFERGIDVRISDIVWCADAPWGS